MSVLSVCADYEDSMKWLNDAANCDLIHKSPVKSMTRKSRLPIGNWLLSKQIMTRIETRG